MNTSDKSLQKDQHLIVAYSSREGLLPPAPVMQIIADFCACYPELAITDEAILPAIAAFAINFDATSLFPEEGKPDPVFDKPALLATLKKWIETPPPMERGSLTYLTPGPCETMGKITLPFVVKQFMSGHMIIMTGDESAMLHLRLIDGIWRLRLLWPGSECHDWGHMDRNRGDLNLIYALIEARTEPLRMYLSKGEGFA